MLMLKSKSTRKNEETTLLVWAIHWLTILIFSLLDVLLDTSLLNLEGWQVGSCPAGCYFRIEWLKEAKIRNMMKKCWRRNDRWVWVCSGPVGRSRPHCYNIENVVDSHIIACLPFYVFYDNDVDFKVIFIFKSNKITTIYFLIVCF